MPWRERSALPAWPGDPTFGAMRREMDALLNDMWSGNNARTLESVERAFPQVNVSENPEAWRVTAELPGLDEKDVQVSFESNLLLIAGKKSDEKEEKGRTWYRRERRSGEFQRAIELPATIDMTKATATFQKGVLVVDVPKMPEAKSSRRTIEVKSA
jgi:HSP20 family protein